MKTGMALLNQKRAETGRQVTERWREQNETKRERERTEQNKTERTEQGTKRETVLQNGSLSSIFGISSLFAFFFFFPMQPIDFLHTYYQKE